MQGFGLLIGEEVTEDEKIEDKIEDNGSVTEEPVEDGVVVSLDEAEVEIGNSGGMESVGMESVGMESGSVDEDDAPEVELEPVEDESVALEEFGRTVVLGDAVVDVAGSTVVEGAVAELELAELSVELPDELAEFELLAVFELPEFELLAVFELPDWLAVLEPSAVFEFPVGLS
jgi:hypothetical protein